MGALALAYATDLRFGNTALSAKRHHKLIDHAGGNAGDVGLHHQSPKGPVNAPTGFEQ